MSEAPTAPAAETLAPAAEAAPAAAAPAATSLVAGATDAGEGTGGEPAGQGAGSEPAAEGGAPAGSEPPKEGEGEAATGAPEQYADFTLPEGVELEGAMLDQVRTFAKAQNFTQEQAQGLVDLGVAQAQQTAQRFADLASESPVVLSQAWAQRWSEHTASDSA
jgi:hypothetical protein